MSSQLQVTGEAKIRDIQGPVVANSGVITALNGAASQYVRGDGTLADFPTSSGGGSSVSYYLNSSVSQGTIGGVAYRELSKEPIIGAGTDIAISTTGYVASYITDANDPDVSNILLQMLDEGHITSSAGKRVDVKNTIIILTSNLGARDNESNAIGFGSQEKTGNEDKAMKEFFKPELRNRIDQICRFNKLDRLAIKKIVIKFADQLKASLDEKHIKLVLSEEVIDMLADKGYDPKMGARPLARKIDELIKVPLSKKILFDRLSDCDVFVTMQDDAVHFESVAQIIPVVDDDGIIRFPDV